jgi:hypothetical protein
VECCLASSRWKDGGEGLGGPGTGSVQSETRPVIHVWIHRLDSPLNFTVDILRFQFKTWVSDSSCEL